MPESRDAFGANRPKGQLPTSPPRDAVLPPRALHAPAPGDPIPSHYRWCFGCASEHSTGLHMRITAGEGMTVRGVFTPSEHHQGAPGLAHGGVLATALDEVLGSLNWLLAGPAVTGRLECDFRRPVPIGTSVHIEADVVGVKGRKVFTRAVGRLDSPDGPIAISAAALFVQVPVQHFVEHGAAEQVRQAFDDRATGGPAWRSDAQQDVVEVNP